MKWKTTDWVVWAGTSVLSRPVLDEFLEFVDAVYDEPYLQTLRQNMFSVNVYVCLSFKSMSLLSYHISCAAFLYTSCNIILHTYILCIYCIYIVYLYLCYLMIYPAPASLFLSLSAGQAILCRRSQPLTICLLRLLIFS
jgi:hypothetical protein